MGKLIIHNEKIADKVAFAKKCPFGAMELSDGNITVNAGCKMCKLCVKASKNGEAEFIEEKIEAVDKSAWNGICVYADHVEGAIHPVTLELIGKARELAAKINHKVICLFMGADITDKARELLHYGVDEVYIYDNEKLRHFSMEPYAAVFEDFINKVKPSSILVGATNVGRQLAPRVAARFRTGLTADCTILDMRENTDLVQIRPAFGGNIMAQILTPNNRPQMATVRYKIMDAPKREAEEKGKIISCTIADDKLTSKVFVKSVEPKEKKKTIENADVLVVAGRGVKNKDELEMLGKLADLLGGQLAGTRPMVESGMIEAAAQIGLSGRTVRPKLIITCGVSGAIQFVAGMNNSENIFAINKDEKAPIFKTANYGIVGDFNEVIPQLIEKIEAGRGIN